jgi:hypothetical protein
MKRRVLAACILAILALPALHAQGAIADKLAAAKKLKCSFAVYSLAAWSKEGKPEPVLKPSTLSFTFDEIVADEATARVIGPFGPSDITVRFAGGVLHFMQSFREGPIYLTTIFPMELPTKALQAVHTRHENTQVSLPGFTSKPEQYYGQCEIQE